MKRRRFVAAVSGAVATAGCAAAFGSEPGPIVETEFSISERSDRGTGFFTEAPDREDPPAVTFSPEENRVRVMGKMEVGMPCREAVLNETTYDSGADELRVRVGRSDVDDEICRSIPSIDAYRAEIEFEDTLPETVVVEEEFPTDIDKTTVYNPTARAGTTDPS